MSQNVEGVLERAREALHRHKNAVLQFSGGKDSLACLHILRPLWDRFTVLWMNTGDSFPETRDQMGDVARMVPHFLEVQSQQPAQHCRSGPPSDLVPAWTTEMGRLLDETISRRIQMPFACCNENIWAPMDQATRKLGATLIIRGQRTSEAKKSPIRSGFQAGELEALFPIEDWSADDVRSYLSSQNVDLPEHYAYFDSSLDCQHCTAYLSENAGKFTYLRERHPKTYKAVQERLTYIRDAVLHEFGYLTAVCDG